MSVRTGLDESERTYVLTLALDDASFTRLDAMRRQHFPKSLNFLPAHLTLFHRLDEQCIRALMIKVFHLSGAAYLGKERIQLPASAIPLQFSRLRSLGNGVALEVGSPDLVRLHRGLAALFQGHLTAQDSGEFWPHVTIQNKVSATDARTLMSALAPRFQFWEGQGVGLLVWRYLAGRWEKHAEVAFEAST